MITITKTYDIDSEKHIDELLEFIDEDVAENGNGIIQITIEELGTETFNNIIDDLIRELESRKR